MYILGSTEGYISGVFKEMESLIKYLEKLPYELRVNQRIKYLGDIDYPLYVLERDRKFEFVSELEGIDGVDIYYIVYEDYETEDAKDMMGSLEHYHMEDVLYELNRISK